MNVRIPRRRSLPAVCLLLAACSATRQEQVENVAKDWCLAIRANQVMPVYPLTRDVQPGDVFLVRMPIDQQQREWRKRGYLPLDNHLARLEPAGYAAFYRNSFPPDGEPPSELPLRHLRASPAWSTAPHAGFPTYGFSVKKGGGLRLALPVSGVPVGLGLLGASSAEGTISIGRARTLGVDLVSLDGQLRSWSREPESRAFLAGLASRKDRKSYVRVVTRVYLTGELDVALRDTTQRSLGADAGVPSPVAALVPDVARTAAATGRAAASDYKEAIDELNKMLGGTGSEATGASHAPGGSLRLVAATARTVVMKESFDPPLVLGYLGFDCEIGPGGELGPAVPTYALVSGQLGGELLLGREPAAQAWLDSMWSAIYEIARTRADSDGDARKAADRCDALGAFVPLHWSLWSWTPDPLLRESRVARPAGRAYPAFRQYLADLGSSAKALETALAEESFRCERPGADPEELARGSDAALELHSLREAIRFQSDDERILAAHAEARRALADWLFANLYATPPR